MKQLEEKGVTCTEDVLFRPKTSCSIKQIGTAHHFV